MSSKPVSEVPVHRQDSELQCVRTFDPSSQGGPWSGNSGRRGHVCAAGFGQ